MSRRVPAVCSLKLLVDFLVSQRAWKWSIHPSIHPSRGADSSCPVAQDRTSLRGTVVSFVPLSCLTFPRPALVPLHAYSVGKQASQPARQGTSIHPDSQSVIHPSIHTFKRLTSCTPLGQNKASLWGTVVRFVPPSCLTFPRPSLGPPLKAQGTGRSTGLSTPPFPLSLSDIIALLDPHHHTITTTTSLFFWRVLKPLWMSFLFSPSHKTDS